MSSRAFPVTLRNSRDQLDLGVSGPGEAKPLSLGEVSRQPGTPPILRHRFCNGLIDAFRGRSRLVESV